MSVTASIDRVRLAFLVACAVLASTLGAFVEDPIEPTSQAAMAPMAVPPSVSSPGPAQVAAVTDGVAVPSSPATLELIATAAAEEKLVAKILQRLSIRHTGLPERERIALVRTIRGGRAQKLNPGRSKRKRSAKGKRVNARRRRNRE